MAFAPDICLSEFCLVDGDIFAFVCRCAALRPQMWLHDKAVGAPDLRRHVGRSREEHIPEVEITR